MSNPQQSIRIGTMVGGNQPDPAGYLKKILPHGFESIQITFWQVVNQDLAALAQQMKETIGDADVTMPTLAIFGNPLEDGEIDQKTLRGWEQLIDHARLFGADTVCGFTGRIRGKPIEQSLPQYTKVFGELGRRAADQNVRLAFENCAMDGNWKTGDWNIAHSPDAWEMMFNAVPAKNIGLEWEPAHQMLNLIDPMPQIRKWANRIFHVHGKDATIRRDVIREHGINGKEQCVFMRTPGFGDTNWTDVISELRLMKWTGSIDIEGWHDPVYRDALEMTGQVHALNYLKHCRGGAYVGNP